MSSYLLMNRDQLTKQVETIIENYLSSRYIAVGGDEHPISEYLESLDSEFTARELANEISTHVTEDFLEKMRYTFMPSFYGLRSGGACKECGTLNGQWVSRYSGSTLSSEQIRGMHIIVPQ